MLSEQYINEKINPTQSENLEVTVNDGFIFVMGDNRNNSTDSRSEILGQINVKNVLGKAMFRIFPFDKVGVIE